MAKNIIEARLNNGEKSLASGLKRHIEEIERRIDYNTIHSYFIAQYNLFWNKFEANVKTNKSSDKSSEYGFGLAKKIISDWLWWETRNRISDEIELIVFKVFLTEANYYLPTKDLNEDVIIELITKEQIKRRKSGSLELHQFLKEGGITPTAHYTPNIVSYIKEEMNEENYKQFYQEVASIIHRTISKQIINTKFELPFIILKLSEGSIEEIKKIMFGLENQNKIYEKALEKDKIRKERDTDSILEKIFSVIKEANRYKHTIKFYSEKTNLPEYLVKDFLRNSSTLKLLYEKIQSQVKHYANRYVKKDGKKIRTKNIKEGLEFWEKAFEYFSSIYVYRLKKEITGRKEVSYSDKVAHKETDSQSPRQKAKAYYDKKESRDDWENEKIEESGQSKTCRICQLFKPYKDGLCSDCYKDYGEV